MRFGLSDLGELPSLKEFEQLARAALGTDEGIAPIEPEMMEATDAAADVAAENTEAAEAVSVNGTANAIETAAAIETRDQVETVTVSEALEAHTVSELTEQEPQAAPEAAQAAAEHFEKARAESAS